MHRHETGWKEGDKEKYENLNNGDGHGGPFHENCNKVQKQNRV